MRKVLIRTNMWPEGKHTVEDVILNNRIGSNIGNMLFPHSVIRWLMEYDPKVKIVPINDKIEKNSRIVNKECEMLILPFANAFRKDYINNLKKWTSYIKTLTIPCVVIGIGYQGELQADGSEPKYENDFNKDVKAFCDAVLEKSRTIGVRGEYTKNYLRYIGIPEERIAIIGCPSVYMNGYDYVDLKKEEFESIRMFSMNSSKRSPGYDVVNKWMEEYKNSLFITQETWEMLLLHTGKMTMDVPEKYCIRPGHKYLQEREIVTFVDTVSWLHYLQENVDLSIGTRIHGSVASYISGVPALIIACDTRVRELASYHGLAWKSFWEVTSTEQIRKWYEDLDVTAIRNRYFETIREYEAFLCDNKVPAKAPKNRMNLKRMDGEYKTVSSCFSQNPQEQISNLMTFYDLSESMLKEKNATTSKSRDYWKARCQELEEERKSQKQLEETLMEENQLLEHELKEKQQRIKSLEEKYDKQITSSFEKENTGMLSQIRERIHTFLK